MDALGCTYDKNQVGMFVWGKIPAELNDVEELTEKILDECILKRYFKRHSTYSYDFKEFYDHIEIEKYVIENMDAEYKWFWEELIANLKDEGFNISVYKKITWMLFFSFI